MSELLRDRGPAGVTVAHVVARSGVSRRTFYELFQDREDCLLAAFDAAIATAAASMLAVYREPESWVERIRAGLAAMLRFFDAEPEWGHLCVVGALGGGERALAKRTQVVAKLVDAVHEGRRENSGPRRPDRLSAEGVVGAVLAVIHARLVDQDARQAGAGGQPLKPLLSLLNPLMAMIVLPYLGAAAAERERRRPAPRPRTPPRPRADPLRELDMRLTYRTVRVLSAIAELAPSDTSGGASAGVNLGPSNRQVAAAAGISDQGQISKLLARLQTLGLVGNNGGDHARGEPNAWTLTERGQQVARTLAQAER
ncbi:MAG TPA: TetR/AcrR family transcriptional regulator [Solirubrobacteraceae bacterium]|nr:TetR/AcrR family transcriptional regulator [Solirubrobacteraceae bacterium]